MKSYDISELIDFQPLTGGGYAIVPKRADAPPSRYWRDERGQLHCKHGLILYGRACINCERDATPQP